MSDNYLWWKRGVIYQVYPRSFMDLSGDGVGDLQGIKSKLDYLEWLGIDALWLSPIFPSPMADFGYDISDYTGIHPIFGSMEDFDELLKDCHRRNLKLILDLVPNHTSSQHPWFLESRSSRDNPKRDWYLWKDPQADGSMPNNWLSVFGGSAWEYDESTGQYYYHAFLKEQPDLNWRNPEVQDAMLSNMKFWLDKGVDGFRVDVIWHMIKDTDFRDNPPNPDYKNGMNPYHSQLHPYTTDLAEVHDVINKMRSLVNTYRERLLIGEIYLPVEKLVTYYGKSPETGVHLPFNFQLILTDWNAKEIYALISKYEGALPEGAWPNWVLGNHDNPRIATRVGGRAQAKVAAVLLLTLRGTPTIYYGEEIGMTDVLIPQDKIQDPQGKNIPGQGFNRDHERTPMQWNAEKNAGFTKEEPWLPVAEDYQSNNVAIEKNQENSFLRLYKRLLSLRKKAPALHVGTYTPLNISGDAFAYKREAENDRAYIVGLNFSRNPQSIPLDFPLKGKTVINTHSTITDLQGSRQIKLKGNEGIIVEVS